jgi:rhamnose transport system permease protein
VIQVSPFWQQAIAGAVILVSVALNARSQRQAGRQILEHASHGTAALARSPA